MRRLNFLLTAVLTYSAAVSAVGQITERQRPAEWTNLVRGGRFMDRFEAMPDGDLRADVWGADSVRPRFVDNGIERPDLSFWGGNIVRGDDGRYHLFVCGWPERSEKGHMTWPASTVYHTALSSGRTAAIRPVPSICPLTMCPPKRPPAAMARSRFT